MSSNRKRYIPAPQTETVALTEEELRVLVRNEVTKALVRFRTEQNQMIAEEVKRQMRMQVAASQCRRG